MVRLTRRNLIESSAAAAVGTTLLGTASGQEFEGDDTPATPAVVGDIKRFSTTAFGAEVTGPFVFDTGELLYSLQHPSDDNPEPFDLGGVGVFEGFEFTFDGTNDDFEELEAPRADEQQSKVLSAGGEYSFLAQYGDEINGGTENWGIPQTPDGEDIPGGDSMDMNFFVSTNDEGTEGYLFTNNENTPGSITRTPISRTEDGWEADLENADEIENYDSFRELGGTKINCYGDLSPWETPISAEEEYDHPRLGGLSTVSDIVEQGSGVGIRGGAEFWNRPNLSNITDALDEIFGEDSWYPSGLSSTWSMERLAEYLGADVPDRSDEPYTPIDSDFPNRYRYGHPVEIADPTADEPTPVKHWAMGRAAWECPEILADEQTVYLASDGGAKGIYKFVAEEPIPSYDSRMDVRGTLYAIEVTNAEEARNVPPSEVDLEIDWIELGTASNAEVESWIAEYDDVTQVDYLETHAETDWEEDLEGALREADETVAIEGNQDYITDEEIVEWAEQYEQDGPDGVDEELRRVPFLETRAAAKEVGATIEFNKAEGIDSHDDAQPGDFVYFGISSLDGSMSDDEGDLQLDEISAGVLYRGRLDADYDVSTLEPVVVGPDASDSEEIYDDSLISVDNVMVMDDRRVLLCEDGAYGRSYPNDALYVYEPPTLVEVEGAAIPSGDSVAVDLTADRLARGLSGGRLSVSVEHADVAAIEDVTLPDWIELAAEPEYADDGSAVELRFADLADAVETDATDVTLASLELAAQGTGTTDVDVEVHALDDDAGDAVETQGRPSLVVVGPPPVGDGPGGGRSPRDLDGDGRYEDVNGNGRLDYDDVVVLFDHLEDDGVQLNPGAFDFNENGRVDYDDVVTLYEQL